MALPEDAIEWRSAMKQAFHTIPNLVHALSQTRKPRCADSEERYTGEDIRKQIIYRYAAPFAYDVNNLGKVIRNLGISELNITNQEVNYAIAMQYSMQSLSQSDNGVKQIKGTFWRGYRLKDDSKTKNCSTELLRNIIGNGFLDPALIKDQDSNVDYSNLKDKATIFRSISSVSTRKNDAIKFATGAVSGFPDTSKEGVLFEIRDATAYEVDQTSPCTEGEAILPMGLPLKLESFTREVFTDESGARHHYLFVIARVLGPGALAPDHLVETMGKDGFCSLS